MPTESGSVLIATPRWTRDGGVGAHAIASATALAERGVEVHALAARVEATPTPGVTVHRAPRLFDARLAPERRLAEGHDLHPDVIHLHQLDDPVLLGALRRLAPVVASVHGYSACTSGVHYFRPGEECDRPHGPGCVPNLALRGCAHTRNPRRLPGGYRKASASVAALRRADLAISYSSVIDRHLAVNGIARRALVPLFATMRPAGGTDRPDRRRVVFAGRVIAAKGVGVLIRAARDLEGELVICGDGRELPAMRRLARRLDVQERVSFTGWLDSDELAGQLAGASVVAVPSLWPEPFGLVGIEAGATGRAVVASAIGGIGDWLQEGVSGLGVRPADTRALAGALNELLADPARRRGMGEAGRELVAARFTPERHVAALLRAYAAARASWEAEPEPLAAKETSAEPSQV